MHAERFTVDAVLLDLDGTLIDSGSALERCWTQWAIEHGVSRERFASVAAHGLTSAAMVAALLPPGQVGPALERIEDLEAATTDGVIAYPGAADLLRSLPRDRWAIITSGTERVARARLRAAGLRPPAVLVTADDVAVGKPDPAPYLLGANKLGSPPTQCLVVEDAPAGLESARAAGMRSIAVGTTTPADHLRADALIGRLDELRVHAHGDGAATPGDPGDPGDTAPIVVTLRKSPRSP